MNSPRRVMEPRGVEPLCRNALTRASTRVVNSLISDHLRLLTAWDDPMHTKCRGKPHARVSPPVRCFLDDTPSGVKRHPCSLIRLRVRTAYWQTSFCILFTWPACSTARHQCLESPGRYRYGPVQNKSILQVCSVATYAAQMKTYFNFSKAILLADRSDLTATAILPTRPLQQSHEKCNEFTAKSTRIDFAAAS